MIVLLALSVSVPQWWMLSISSFAQVSLRSVFSQVLKTRDLLNFFRLDFVLYVFYCAYIYSAYIFCAFIVLSYYVFYCIIIAILCFFLISIWHKNNCPCIASCIGNKKKRKKERKEKKTLITQKNYYERIISISSSCIILFFSLLFLSHSRLNAFEKFCYFLYFQTFYGHFLLFLEVIDLFCKWHIILVQLY